MSLNLQFPRSNELNWSHRSKNKRPLTLWGSCLWTRQRITQSLGNLGTPVWGLCVSVLLCHPLSSHLNNLLSQRHVSTLCKSLLYTCIVYKYVVQYNVWWIHSYTSSSIARPGFSGAKLGAPPLTHPCHFQPTILLAHNSSWHQHNHDECRQSVQLDRERWPLANFSSHPHHLCSQPCRPGQLKRTQAHRWFNGLIPRSTFLFSFSFQWIPNRVSS